MHLFSQLNVLRNKVRSRNLRSAVRLRARRLSFLLRNPAVGRVQIHCPEYVEPSDDPGERRLVERIFTAYKEMCTSRLEVSECYLPSSLWQRQIDSGYQPLLAAVECNDIDMFHHFLANFGTWKTYIGVENTTLVWENASGLLRRRYLSNDVFLRQAQFWSWYYNNRKSLELLSYPLHGNQSGAYVDGVFMGVGSAGAEVNSALVAGLINEIKRPVIADLGAGYGKFDYFCLRDRESFSFVDFDLPETLCLASYYLMKIWPEKKTLLFNEDEFTPDSVNEYDLIFMPPWQIERLGNESVDVFINKNSLGEMDQVAASNYINHICRSTTYIYHMNHDNYPNIFTNNERGLLASEYPIPSNQFDLLYRSLEPFHMLHRGGINMDMDIFCYLYVRRGKYL